MALFRNETAVITGAASNLGAAIARRLAGDGADVLLVDIDEDRLQKIGKGISASGHLVHLEPANLADKTSWRKVAEHCEAQNVTMFVHSACPARLETENVVNVSEEAFDVMMNVNVRSGFFLGRALASQMHKQQIAGRLLFITSLHSATPRNLPHYAAAKAGMTMIVKEMARHFAPAGIRVNALAPGAVPGGGFKPVGGFDVLKDRIPVNRVGVADEIAATAITLLSDTHTSYVTGASLVVDGGLDLFNWIDVEPS